MTQYCIRILYPPYIPLTLIEKILSITITSTKFAGFLLASFGILVLVSCLHNSVISLIVGIDLGMCYILLMDTFSIKYNLQLAQAKKNRIVSSRWHKETTQETI